MKFVILCVLCAFAVSSCIRFGITPAEALNSCKQALQGTKGKTEITVTDPNTGKVISATGTTTFTNDAAQPPPSGPDGKQKSCIEQLWAMFGLAFILSILLSWVGVKYLKMAPYLAIIPSFWLSILINLGILGVWLLSIYKGWSNRHWLDVTAMNVTAWGCQALLYDKLNIKKVLKGKEMNL